MSGGVCSIYKESSSEMTVFTVVPSSVMTQGTMRVLTVLIGIYLFVAVVAVVLSIYFSKRFTSPIREISEEMTQFDGNDFSRLIELNTNTELDQIGHSYNKMRKEIYENQESSDTLPFHWEFGKEERLVSGQGFLCNRFKS